MRLSLQRESGLKYTVSDCLALHLSLSLQRESGLKYGLYDTYRMFETSLPAEGEWIEIFQLVR